MDGIAQSSSSSKDARQPSVAHSEEPKGHGVFDIEARDRNRLNAIFENPLRGVPRDQLFMEVDKFCKEYGLEEYNDLFRKGALISQDPSRVETMPDLSEDDREALRREKTHKWSQPWMLFFMASKLTYAHVEQEANWTSAMCSMAAAVQGMDETANNGAVVIYPKVRGFILLGHLSDSSPGRSLTVIAPWYRGRSLLPPDAR